MSRVAKAPVIIPDNVEVKFSGQDILVQGKNGKLIHNIHYDVNVQKQDNKLIFSPNKKNTISWALAGTTRSLINCMIIGVTIGFTKKLNLIGVGYRATIKENILHLSLGFSHPVYYKLPEGITGECPTQTEILLKSADKQAIGQVAAEIRAYRPPEPYKGKGIRYADEIVRTKEAKKK